MAWAKLSVLGNLALLLHSASAVPASPSLLELGARDGALQWGTIGDSWDAGVAWTKETAYDNNKDYCLRYVNAWSLQMSKDQSWVTNGQKFTFAGCSAAKMPAMVSGYSEGTSQLNKVDNPLLLIMMVGGNDAKFGLSVDGCIYHGNPFKGYGKPWDQDTDGSGECKKQIKAAEDYINSNSNEDGKGLRHDITTTIDDVMKVIAKNGQKQFALYIPGYAQFFDETTDDCDKWTFAPAWTLYNKPKVVKGLRKVFNDNIKAFNSLYRDVIENYKMPDGVPKTGFSVHYVSIDEGFQGGRFCEPGASFEDQWYKPGTLVWNLNGDEFNNPASDEGVYKNKPIVKTANGTTYLANGPTKLTKNITVLSSEGVALEEGWTAKPFHPKKGGHTAIKDLVIAQIRKDAVIPGVSPIGAAGGSGGGSGSTLPATGGSATQSTKTDSGGGGGGASGGTSATATTTAKSKKTTDPTKTSKAAAKKT